MTIKEMKEEYSKMTLGEIRGNFDRILEVRENFLNLVKTKSKEILELNFEENKKNCLNCFCELNDKINSLHSYNKSIKEYNKELSIIKPILEKKENEGLKQDEYEKYVENNADIQILLDYAEKDKNEFIKNGGCIIILKDGKEKKMYLSNEQIEDIYKNMLVETVFMLKDYIGSINKIDRFEANPNRGFDGIFTGEKGSISINTVLAGGYNIQKVHFRTLIRKIL